MVMVIALFAAGAGWSLARCGLAIAGLGRLLKKSSPVPSEIVEWFDRLYPTRSVTLLSSAQIDAPMTFGVFRPVLILPAAMLPPARRQVLQDCLAHEWSHIRSYDVAQLWALQALEPLVWFQPCYWILRRQLRLCQDQLADHFATSGTADSFGYAELLLELARSRDRAPTNLAASIGGGRSNLFRRIEWLLSQDHRLSATCRGRALAVAATLLSLAVAAVVMVNLGHAQPAAAQGEAKPAAEQPAAPQPDAKQLDAKPEAAASEKPAVDPTILGEELPDGSLRYSGVILDKTNEQPIAGAVVTVRRRIASAWDNRTIEETKHTTDVAGRYGFVVPPEQTADKFLYIELDVEHPDYATKAGFGYSLAMIRKNAKLNDPPFFSRVHLDPGEALSGRIVGPDGKPLPNVAILAYSKLNPRDFSGDNYGSFFRTRSTDDGTFRLSLTKEGQAVFWIVPDDYAPRQIVVGAKRGDWGDVQMDEGVTTKGQVVDADGKPLADVWVDVTDDKSQREIQMPVATALCRSAKTDAEGHFEIGPMKPGPYLVEVKSYPDDIRYFKRGRQRADLPAVFPRRTVTLGGDAPQPLLVQAVPHVQFEGQYLDSAGQPRSGGWEFTVFGKLDGEFYFAQLRPNAAGHIQGLLPRGLAEAKLQTMSNEHGSLRVRLAKDGPLIHGRGIPLGIIDADIAGVQIVRYTAPIVLLKVVDEAGHPIAGAKTAGIYQEDEANDQKLVRPVGGIRTSIFFEKQPGGVFRTSQMLPEEKTKFIASAEGYDDAQETLSLPEGQTRELTLVLKRPAPPAQDGAATDGAAATGAELAAAPPNAEDRAAGEKALARLKELGAYVLRGSNEGGEWIGIYFVKSWKGTSADLDLLNRVAALGQMRVMIDFRDVSPGLFAEFKLRKPLTTLEFEAADDRVFDQLAALPESREIVFRHWSLSPAGCRRFVELAAGIESLKIQPVHSDNGKSSASKFTDAVAAELARLRNLKALELGSAAITGAGLKHLAGMKHLETLVLSACPALAKSDLAALADFDALRSLELYFPLSADSLTTLGKLDALEKLHFQISMIELSDGTPVAPDNLQPADFEPLARMTGLRELEVGTFMCSSEGTHPIVAPVKLGDAIAQAASRAPSLQTFKLFCVGNHAIDHPGLAALATSATLENLQVSAFEPDDQSLELVSRIARLRKLYLYCHTVTAKRKISDQGLAHLKNATGLTSLHLMGSKQVTDAGLAHLAGLTALEELTLSDSAITGTGLTALRPLRKLKYLDMRSWQPGPRSAFGDDGCRLLAEVFPELRTLNLCETEITDVGLASIASLSNLRSLDVSDNPALTDAGLTPFEHHKTLETINAQKTKISKPALDEFMATLKHTGE
jgi:hypothetical protein